MRLRDRFRAPQQVLSVFLVVACASTGAIGWLSWQLVSQDRVAAALGRQDQLEQAADRVVATMQRQLAELQAIVGSEPAKLSPGLTAVSMDATGVRVHPEGALLYVPVVPAAARPPRADLFADGERLEFEARDLSGAMRAYAIVAATNDEHVRAEALMRVARVARQVHAIPEALRAYDQLAALDAVRIDDWPAGLVARLGRLSAFGEAGQKDNRRREAAALLDDLNHPRWPLTRATYQDALTEARRWLASAPDADPITIGRAEAAWWLWANRSTSAGRRALALPTGPAFVVWTPRAAAGLNALVADRSFLAGIAGSSMPPGTTLALSDVDGALLLGPQPPDRGAAVRTAVSAGLPWSLHVFAEGAAPAPAWPRLTLVALVTAVMLVLVAGWYFIYRSLMSERRIAALQSDFVAAVSHEFRSPLTTLGHAADLLVEGRLESEDSRRQSYAILARETARLRGLVESLLDFGRFDAGKDAFRFERLEVRALVGDTVASFQAVAATSGFHVELSAAEVPIFVCGDREALTRALWNLLDNAVKYSPECRTVWVDVERQADRVLIAVRDRGLGIPLDEQPLVFERFVRGVASKSRRIHGTGIGLAMVRTIARAHQGDVTLASSPGEGSRFTLVLATEDAA